MLMPSKAKRSTKKSTTKAKPRLAVEKSAGAVVFRRAPQIEYLLILSTSWEFPKGLIDVKESEESAAKREVREETGLEVQFVPGFREEINYFYRRGGVLVKKQVIYFLGEAAESTVKISWEHQDAAWLTFEAALAQLKYESAREILKKANAFLRA